MGRIISVEDFCNRIYEKFPFSYREDDTKENYSLQRYMRALSEGGFKYILDDLSGLEDLLNPNNTDIGVLKVLFSQLGLDLFNGIPEEYLRYLLPQLCEVWSHKGSIEALEFLAGSIAGVIVNTTITYDDDGYPTANVVLEATGNVTYLPTVQQMNRVAKVAIPFYSDVNFIYAFMFFEAAELIAEDDLEDNVSESLVEAHKILGRLFVKFENDLNMNSKLLNSTLVLSHVVQILNPDADYTEDIITQNGVSTTITH